VEVVSHNLTFGERTATLGTVEDVTERARAELALAERIAMTAPTADIGVALNRPCEQGAGGCPSRTCAIRHAIDRRTRSSTPCGSRQPVN
jgi:hypothetical protein